MRLARFLLASTAVLVLAACGSDPVAVDGRSTPESLRKTTVSTDSTGAEPVLDADDAELSGSSDACLVPQLNPDGTVVTVNVCTGLGPWIGGGGG